jgi:peroxiredoxin Q/BCP
MAKTPEIGSPAPDFTLPGLVLTDGSVQRADYSLSAERGHPVVLAFYPGDDTPTCTKQMCAYTSELDRFKGLSATVLGISPQGLDSHEKFARKHQLAFPLLSDTEGTAIRAYGIGMPGLGLRRSVFIVDADGVLRWKHVALIGVTYQNTDTLTEQLARLS